MVDKIVSLLQAILRLFRAAENLLVDIAAAIAPWLTPLPSANMTYTHMIGALGFPEWVAFWGAVCIELLGLSAVQTAFLLWQYNTEKRQIDKSAPVFVAIFACTAYVAIVLLIIIPLDDAAPQVKVVRAGLASLPVIGAVVLALRASHARRLAAIQAERDRVRAERAAAKTQDSQNVRQSAENAQNVRQSAQKTDWRRDGEKIDPASIWAMTSAEVAQNYGLSIRAAENWRSRAWAKMQEIERNSKNVV